MRWTVKAPREEQTGSFAGTHAEIRREVHTTHHMDSKTHTNTHAVVGGACPHTHRAGHVSVCAISYEAARYAMQTRVITRITHDLFPAAVSFSTSSSFPPSPWPPVAACALHGPLSRWLCIL